MMVTDYPATKGETLTFFITFGSVISILIFADMLPMASEWLDLNMLMLSPTLAAVDSTQPALIKLLESRGIDVMPTLLRHGRVLGGGPHCITLDTRRTGGLESYF